MNDQNIIDHETCNHTYGLKYMSWTGIVAGALIAVGLSFLLSLFGAAIGLSAYQTTAQGASTIAIGGYIGMIIGTIAIMFLAGWVAGYIGRKHCFHRNVGALYGLTAWCLGLVIMVVIATQTMQFISANLYSITNHKVTTAELFHQTANRIAADPAYDNLNNRMDQNKVNNVNDRNLLSEAFFLTFSLFFIGAISSALGGYSGAKLEYDACHSQRIDTRTP